jgi:serine/threonine-protein kinase RsbT
VAQQSRPCPTRTGRTWNVLVTAASELARSTLAHGGGGRLEITPLAAGPNRGLLLTFLDTGPGIRDVQQAMTDGFTTGGGLGLGLSGAKGLVNEFRLGSRPGAGTTVTIAAWASGAPSPRAGAG